MEALHARPVVAKLVVLQLSSHKTIASLSPTEFPNLTEFREVLNAGMGSPGESGRRRRLP